MESEPSESNLIIITRRDRLKLVVKLYWRSIVIVGTPIVLLPIAFIGENNAYRCFYTFLVSIVYWMFDVMHQSATSLVPVALYSLIMMREEDPHRYSTQATVKNEVLDCMSVMMIGIAIEYSQLNKRMALKLLMTFGCSHYKISFLLFFTAMCLSMLVTDIIACGLMMPFVRAILKELEKMGILEMYEMIDKTTQQSLHHEVRQPRPTDFTVFYFLGIASSSSIGGIATIVGSHVNQIMKSYFEQIFPNGPKIEFPHFMLLSLPAVLLQETLLYLWMNSYFMGMFRANSTIALEIGMTEEESAYIKTLLIIQYQQMGKISFHEWVVGSVVIVTCLLEIGVNAFEFNNIDHTSFEGHLKTSAPCLIGLLMLFIIPIKPDFIKFFRKRDSNSGPLPQFPSRGCLNWTLIKRDMNWSVLFPICGSCFIFEALKDSHMTLEFDKFLSLFKTWYPTFVVLVVICLCKVMTEFASNPCVVYTLLPSVAKLAIVCDINPHCLMMAATLSSALPFHLITGSPTNSMVVAYASIQHKKMMYAGIGPSISAILIIWFTTVVWAKAIWTDILSEPPWARVNSMKFGPSG